MIEPGGGGLLAVRDSAGTEHDIGRIFLKSAGHPEGLPWFWAV
jgi:hypothetical protein